MEKHLKNGLIFAVVFMFVFLILEAIAWTGEQETFITAITYTATIPLMWFLDLIGLSGCQAMGLENLALIILSIPLYYLTVGFFIGFLFSALIEAIVTAKERKCYSKSSPRELENKSSDE